LRKNKRTGVDQEHTSTSHRPALNVMIGVADIVAFRGRMRGDVLVYEALSLELEVGHREARVYQPLHVTD
jgi:hypothetical protein